MALVRFGSSSFPTTSSRVQLGFKLGPVSGSVGTRLVADGADSSSGLAPCGPDSWRALIGSFSGVASSLDCFPPVLMDGELIAVLSDEIFGEGKKLWANSLVGQFQDSRPLYAVVSCLMARIWASAYGHK